MGLVQAAKISHVPSIFLSEKPGPTFGIRQRAVDSLRELGRRAEAAGVDTFVVLDVHWQVSVGFHLNAKERHAGEFTSSELPHFIDALSYDYEGDPALAKLVGEVANARGAKTRVHEMPGLDVEYGTLIPMRHMNPAARARVLPVACNVYASLDEHRAFGEALRDAIDASDRRVSLLASGSLSHQFMENARAEAGMNAISDEFNRQVDLRVLELWQAGRWAEFFAMFPSYAVRCHGEAGMADTAMLLGALGWDAYPGRGEVLGEYFPSSGTGQVFVDFPLSVPTSTSAKGA